jgi:hypothetical protein
MKKVKKSKGRKPIPDAERKKVIRVFVKTKCHAAAKKEIDAVVRKHNTGIGNQEV